MKERIRIEGINLSKKLIAVKLCDLLDPDKTLNQLCSILAIHQININFLSSACINNKGYITCCVEEGDREPLEEIIGSETGLSSQAEIIPSVGLLTVFPHQNSLKAFGIALRVFADSGISLYGLSSSISSFCFVLDFNHFNKMVLALQKSMEVHPDQIYSKEELDNWR